MKRLYICLTDFQILNAISMQYAGNEKIEADIMLVTNKEGNYELAKRLQSTGFFENAFLLNNSRIQGMHMYLRNATEGKKHITLINSLKNSLNEIKHIVFSKIKGKGYAINNKMILGGTMDFSQYDSVFCLDKRQLVVDCVQEILKATEQKCKINLLDEGTSTYWRSILTKKFPINEIFLMAPKLANCFHEGWENRINTIPAININDDKFRNIINYVFAFEDDGHYLKNKNGLYEMGNQIVFFDQNWDPMPEYFSKLNRFMKFLLHNSYKKHKKESMFYERKMDMFRIVADNSNNNKVVVKLHPRSPLSFIKDYQKSCCEMAHNIKIPWEVFMDNCSFKNNIWITVSSTALCTYRMAFTNRSYDIPMIFLYKIVYKGNMDFREDDEFFQHFKEEYPDSVFIPETIDEFRTIYNELVNKMSRQVNANE